MTILAQADGFITQDPLSGVVELDPTVIVEFLLVVLVSSISAVVALHLVYCAAKWAYKVIFSDGLNSPSDSFDRPHYEVRDRSSYLKHYNKKARKGSITNEEILRLRSQGFHYTFSPDGRRREFGDAEEYR